MEILEMVEVEVIILSLMPISRKHHTYLWRIRLF